MADSNQNSNIHNPTLVGSGSGRGMCVWATAQSQGKSFMLEAGNPYHTMKPSNAVPGFATFLAWLRHQVGGVTAACLLVGPSVEPSPSRDSSQERIE